MDEIQERLTKTSETCSDAYKAWSSEKKDSEKREALRESVHELRKVASRLEIEIAVSERDEQSKNPIPIPSHRTRRKGKDQGNDDLPDFIKGDNGNNGQGNKPKRAPTKRTGRTLTKKSQE